LHMFWAQTFTTKFVFFCEFLFGNWTTISKHMYESVQGSNKTQPVTFQMCLTLLLHFSWAIKFATTWRWALSCHHFQASKPQITKPKNGVT
jgi:hypothetical protein